MALGFGQEKDKQPALKVNLWLIAVTGLFGLLFIRFWVLQVIQGETWSFIAEKNQIRKITVPSMRGNIYDRNKKPLADWRQSFNVTVTPADVTEEAIQRLSKILSITTSEMKRRIREDRTWSEFIPVVVAEDVDWQSFARVEENRLLMPGVDTEVRPVRKYYPHSRLTSHVLGYLGEVTKEELERKEFEGYRMGDRIGRAAIEAVLERSLRGTDGTSYKLVDARGQELSVDALAENTGAGAEFKEKLEILEEMSWPIKPGKSVVLTLDIELQKIADKHMGEHNGSVVAMDVNTGEILAMLSRPYFDPVTFTKDVTEKQWKNMCDLPHKPLLNRVIQGVYPPGSIFKIVIAAAGLEEGIITQESTFKCDGSFTLKDTTFGCWQERGHGKIGLSRAIVESCDVYFYKLAHQMGILTIKKWAERFGFGRPVSTGLPEEKAGLVPGPEWKRKNMRFPWLPGETVLVAIGQGYMLITPVQAILIPAAVAGKGWIMQPQIIHHLEDVHGNHITRFQPRLMNNQVMKKETAEFLAKAMEGVVDKERGTAHYYVKSEAVDIAGKTGTTEVSKRFQGEDIEDIPYKYRDHSWFVAYAPADEPEIATVVMVEHGGSGGATAGAITRRILEEYFTLRTARGIGNASATGG